MITEFEFKLKDMPTNKPDAISVFIFFIPLIFKINVPVSVIGSVFQH